MRMEKLQEVWTMFNDNQIEATRVEDDEHLKQITRGITRKKRRNSFQRELL